MVKTSQKNGRRNNRASPPTTRCPHLQCIHNYTLIQQNLRTLLSCCLCFRSSASLVSLDGPTTSSQGPNHERPVELRCCRTSSVAQSSCCSVETRDDSAHFQETTEGLSVPHLMCWQTEGTFTTARRCYGVFMILVPDIKLQTYLLKSCLSVC